MKKLIFTLLILFSSFDAFATRCFTVLYGKIYPEAIACVDLSPDASGVRVKVYANPSYPFYQIQINASLDNPFTSKPNNNGRIFDQTYSPSVIYADTGLVPTGFQYPQDSQVHTVYLTFHVNAVIGQDSQTGFAGDAPGTCRGGWFFQTVWNSDETGPPNPGNFKMCGAHLKHNQTGVIERNDGDLTSIISGTGEQDLLYVFTSEGNNASIQKGAVYYKGNYFSSEANASNRNQNLDNLNDVITESTVTLRSDLYGAQWHYDMCFVPGPTQLAQSQTWEIQVFSGPKNSNVGPYIQSSNLQTDFLSNCQGFEVAKGWESVSATGNSFSFTGNGSIPDCDLRFLFKEHHPNPAERTHTLEQESFEIYANLLVDGSPVGEETTSYHSGFNCNTGGPDIAPNPNIFNNPYWPYGVVQF